MKLTRIFLEFGNLKCVCVQKKGATIPFLESEVTF